ncbi:MULTISPECIES: LysR family transcriptional regulator [Kitasatospora]|uniref:LysR substrate-binding domain-containing protein n=1 Tax=Kitasatospora TaxID=2063 RepID=UPI000C70EEF0|nr:LysR family transcriptional regulator [Kitasatospora sp. GP30]MDH6139409.1 DNA-binding transcriptional LysR family regulator [Kitasatospora sp. GP30]
MLKLPPPRVTFDLDLVWCFIVVAEFRHFGRAAEALHTTQPSLSRKIRRLEQRLGAQLFDRTPHGNRLTRAGEVFLPLAGALLRSADQAAARTQAAARPDRVTIGYTPGIIITPAVRELRRHHPGAAVATRHLTVHDWRQALADHRVDAVVTRLPFPTDGLELTPLYDEPRLLLVPLDHRLAGRDSVTPDDIADEPLPRIRGLDPMTSAFWRLDPRPDGRPAPDGPLADAIEDVVELTAAGQAVMTTVPAHPVRPDLTAIPLEGVEPSHVVLVTRAHDRSPLVAAFRARARAHLTGPASTGHLPRARSS